MNRADSRTDCLPSRRQILEAGAIGYFGLNLPTLLRAEAEGQTSARRTADSCILIFLDGGPSHLDMWDLKPSAPAEIRGEFKPIATSLPGVQFGEHLPKMARWMHECTLIRSAHHGVNNSHAAAVYAAMTGHDRGEIGGGARPTDWPAIGSVFGRMHPPQVPIVPYVSLPFITKEGAGGPPQPGFFGGWMGRAYDPLFVLKDPNQADFQIEELSPRADLQSARLESRKQLLRDLKTGQASSQSESLVRDLDGFRQRAFELLTSGAAQKAFQIEQEPGRIRDAYGRNIYGQSVLLARRLIEAGTRMVSVSWAPDANATWDTHGGNFTKLKNELLPQLDSAVSALLSDLHARNRLDRTLVVVMGEFGRTPKINGAAGRDHWNFCYSLLMAGGGVKPGYVYGASDKIGGRPSLNPVSPADIVATIYHCLGISKDLELRDSLDRPFTLVPWGSHVPDLLV
ncbi:DUF1501 domain-containing protein [Tuwongella immobilis]|uniref:DUF1501 domain-containing protein n=1 Tax=Tuwongella immobilis TaxID=692036 RepID=A0A6C2YLB3_9BACT